MALVGHGSRWGGLSLTTARALLPCPKTTQLPTIVMARLVLARLGHPCQQVPGQVARRVRGTCPGTCWHGWPRRARTSRALTMVGSWVVFGQGKSALAVVRDSPPQREPWPTRAIHKENRHGIRHRRRHRRGQLEN